MIVVLDASTLINLANGGVLRVVLAVPDYVFFLSRIVKEESRTVAAAVEALLASGEMTLVDDDSISALSFVQARDEWKLGTGETEAIIASRAMGAIFACDDALARKRGQRELGVQRVIGSLGLLKCAVEAGLILSNDAANAVIAMKAEGGFLPDVEKQFWTK